jgi:hypothetical protein
MGTGVSLYHDRVDDALLYISPAAMSDQRILIAAIEMAGVIIAEHIEPGRSRDPEQIISRLVAVLILRKSPERSKG